MPRVEVLFDYTKEFAVYLSQEPSRHNRPPARLGCGASVNKRNRVGLLSVLYLCLYWAVSEQRNLT